MKLKKTLNFTNESIIVILLSFFSVLMIIGIFGFYIEDPPFSPDSWSYLELSKSINGDFYKINTYRQFQYPESYGVSFPPLFPVIIYFINFVFDIGIYAGYMFNFFIVLVTLYLFIKISEQLFLNKIIGIILFILLLLNPNYINEVVAARAIPLSLALFFFMFFITTKYYTKRKNNIGLVIILGFISGLMVLNRFDFLLPAITLGLMTIFMGEKKNANHFFLFIALFFITISPYMIYSYTHFDKIFVSDNSRTVLLAFDNFVTDYFNDEESLPTLFNSPLLWIKEVFLRSIVPLVMFIVEMIDRIGLLLIMFLIILIRSRDIKKDYLEKDTDEKIQKFLLFIPSLITLIASISLTGYFDLRYFSLPIIFIAWLISYLMINHLKSMKTMSKPHYFKGKKIVIAIFLLVLILNSNVKEFTIGIQKITLNPNRLNNNHLTTNEYEHLLVLLLKDKEQEKIRIMIDRTVEPKVVPEKFGALTGITTLITPRNLEKDNILLLIEEYDINYVYLDNDELLEEIARKYPLKNYNGSHLYFLTKP